MRIACVIGMGRSGTSLTCQILSKLGVYFGELGQLLPASPNNRRGYFEHAGINGVLEGALSENRMTWLSSQPIPLSWYNSASGLRARDVIDDCLGELQEQCQQTAATVLGFKNPRTILFLSMFRSLFAARNLEPVYIRCLRDPREVYESIRRLEPPELPRLPLLHTAQRVHEARTLTLRECHAIWSYYFTASQAVPALSVWFEDWFGNHAAAQLGRLTRHVLGEDARPPLLTLSDVIDSSLRHTTHGDER